MAVTSKELKGKGSAGGKLVSVAAWCVAVWTTQEFIGALAPQGAAAAGSAVILWAALLQAIFTWAESPIWSARGRWWHFAMLTIDTITNIGGLYFFVTRLDQTDSWRAFNEGLGTAGGINPLAALFVSGVLGVLLAATPEFLWRQ